MRANLLLPLLIGVVASCGGQTQPPPPPPPDAAHFASAVASAFCASLHTCCTAASLTYDDATCTQQVTAYFDSFASEVSPLVTYDPTAAQACIDALKAKESRCTDVTFGLQDWPCLHFHKGSVAPGQACKKDIECAPDPDPSIVSLSKCEGKCLLERVVVPVGGTCQQNGSVYDGCTNGLDCAGTSDNKCPDYLPIGAVCTVGDNPPCALNSYCSGPSTCNPGAQSCQGTCVANKPQGAQCSKDYECGLGSSCFNSTCIVNGLGHFFDISKRSCSIGPLTNGLDDGSLIAK